MNAKQNLFTRYISADEIQTIQKKPVSHLQSSAECHKFPCKSAIQSKWRQNLCADQAGHKHEVVQLASEEAMQ